MLLVTCVGILAACGSSTSAGGASSSTGSTSSRSSIAATGSLPVGDGKVSASSRVGYLDSCQQRFTPGAPGAVANVPRIHGTSWDPSQKIVVGGKVDWPQARITITVRGKTRIIQTRDLPVGATTGTFPISPSSAAYRFDRNPNKIVPQDGIFELPRNPVPAQQPGCLGSGPIGLFTNGVLLFHALDAGGHDAAATGSTQSGTPTASCSPTLTWTPAMDASVPCSGTAVGGETDSSKPSEPRSLVERLG